MTCTDPVADMLTAIRNALQVKFPIVEVKSSKLKEGLLKVLKDEGFIKKFDISKKGAVSYAKVELKYGKNGESVIHSIKRISKPGCRIYNGKAEIPRVKNGFGITVLTTPRGIMSGEAARKAGVGGEVLCEVI